MNNSKDLSLIVITSFTILVFKTPKLLHFCDLRESFGAFLPKKWIPMDMDPYRLMRKLRSIGSNLHSTLIIEDGTLLKPKRGAWHRDHIGKPLWHGI